MKGLQFPPSMPNMINLFLFLKVAVIVITSLAIFNQDLNIVMNDALQNELTSYALVIPFLLIYLIYRKRKMLLAAISFSVSGPIKKPTHFSEIVGALLCVLAFLFYWQGLYTFTPLEYHLATLPLFIAGLILIIFNTKTLKVLAFPLVFLLLLTPPPLQIISQVGAILSTFSSEAAYNILKVLGLPVTLETQYESPLIILNKPGSSPFTFAVEVACSGIYSLLGFTVFAVLFAYIAREAILKKTIVFLAGFPLIYALNILRIVIIVLIGDAYGTEAATQAFHLLGGWVLIFFGTLILLYSFEKICKVKIFTQSTKTEPCPRCNQSSRREAIFCSKCGRFLGRFHIDISKQDLTKMATALIATILILSVQVPIFALTEGPPEILIQSPTGEQAATTQIFPQIRDYNLEFVFRDRRFEEIAPRDAALVYVYSPLNDSAKAVWISLEVGSSKGVWHSWEASVIIWPQKRGDPSTPTQLDLRDVQLLQNPPIIGRFFAFQRANSNTTQVVLYWYENAVFKTGAISEQKYVKISLIAYSNNPRDIYQIEENLMPFSKALINYWQPIKTWSQTALLISKNGDKLIAIIITSLFSVFLLYYLQRQKERKQNNNVYEKLSKANREIIDAIHRTETSVTPTLNNIMTTYQNMTREIVSKEAFYQQLLEAEKVGMIRSDIVSNQDEPIQIWKTESILPRKNMLIQLQNRPKMKKLNALFSQLLTRAYLS